MTASRLDGKAVHDLLIITHETRCLDDKIVVELIESFAPADDVSQAGNET
jgi:hypothetical protein